MPSSEATASGVVDVQSTIFCPFAHPGHTGGPVTASQIWVEDDDSETGLGNELATFRCLYDHTWQRPTTRQQVRMVGASYTWRNRRDEMAESDLADRDVTRQQITPVLG